MSRRAKKAPPPGRWSAEAGLYPYKVIVEENPHRKGGLYLRWWLTDRDNWKRESLGNVKRGKILRDENGEIDQEVAQWAVEQAMRKSQQLSGSIAATSTAKRLTVGEIEALITDEQTGRYPHKTPFRNELVRALRFAETVWGKDTPVDTIDEGAWTRLIRTRVTQLVKQGDVGLSTTETTVSRIITALRWLRKQKKIAPGVGEIDDEWKEDLRAFRRGLTGTKRDPQPYQPRFTLEQMRKIVKAAPFVDPRIAILIYVTAELRLGQTSRSMRSDLKLDAADFGELHIFGAGHKGGEVVELTKGMRVTVDAYLSGFVKPLEDDWLASGKDYPLFPAGRIFGRKHGTDHKLGKKMRAGQHVSRQWIIKTFHAVVAKAGIPYVKGLGPYGLRRLPVDLALEEELGEQGLKALGGWSSTTVPKGVYAERENRIGRRAARDFKARLRGEVEEPADTGPETPAEAFAKVDAANEQVIQEIIEHGPFDDLSEAASGLSDEQIRTLLEHPNPPTEGGSNEG